MTDPLDFSDKTVLITGSSRGIGAELIKAFGKRRAQCVVNYVTDPKGQNKADAQSVARELKDPLVIECDVTKPEQVESMMKQIQDRHGGLDVLVNNSGIISDRTIKKMPMEVFESVLRVNLTGNITVNAIAPGFIDVGMSKALPEEVAENFIKQIPLGRLGDVNEIVDAVLFLASSMASYITGHVLNVNGGFYMG